MPKKTKRGKRIKFTTKSGKTISFRCIVTPKEKTKEK